MKSVGSEHLLFLQSRYLRMFSANRGQDLCATLRHLCSSFPCCNFSLAFVSFVDVLECHEGSHLFLRILDSVFLDQGQIFRIIPSVLMP